MPTQPSIDYQLLPYGPCTWLLQLEDEADIATLHKLRGAPLQHIQECVVGYDSLLIRSSIDLPMAELEQEIQGALSSLSESSKPPRHHIIDVDYSGPDLEEVAEHSGLTKEQVINLHSSAEYSVRFLGFSAGFAYLDGLPKALHLPRRATPRPRMEPGAVAIGGKHAGIYSTPSPGGWNWLGHTSHPLFDPSRDDHSALTLHPGDTLEFCPI